MGTRGFVGFKLKGEIKGWYNHFDSYYSELGMKVLTKFKNNDLDRLKNFFTENVSFSDKDEFYENHRKVFSLNWENEKITLNDETDFLYSGLFCEYGYVFDLDNDAIIVYRGLFKEEQRENQKYYKVYDEIKYFVNEVFTIKRDMIEIATTIFENEDEIRENLSEEPYWEKQYIKELD